MKKSVRDATLRLTESAIMIAVAVVLSEFTVLKFPYGGSVTLFSQLPIVVIAYRYGTKWGLFTGAAMGIIEMILGANNFSYVTGITAVLILAFTDYLLAFGVLGLGGIFRGRLKKQSVELALGALVSSLLRYACHFVSGVTIWSGYAAQANQAVAVYSLSYNGSYMIPETIITIIGAVAVGAAFDLSKKEISRR
ncbi:MAG: energy-coupled thiamine transporter ThiT [Clostridiales bacterium]|nr:energy-coupled thiamine transporter ThiT [Clostridiales bacterium]